MSNAGSGGRKRKANAAGWEAGHTAFAYWTEDDYWYPVVVKSVDGDAIKVEYDDGTLETTDTTSLVEYFPAVGDDVECWSDDDNDGYYEAVIVALDGDKIQIKYTEDGSKEWVDISYLRWWEWSEGDRVFAYWEADEYWYPATVSYVDDEGVHVQYDEDEDDDTVLDDDEVDVYQVWVDDEVECWSEDGYYEATVVAVKDDKVQVQYDEDDSKEWVDLSYLRLPDDE